MSQRTYRAGPQSQRHGLASLGAVLLGLTVGACGANRQVVLSYAHPSPISRWGRRIGVAPFENEGTSRMSQRIQQGLQASPAFEMPPPDQQQMRVIGQVIESSIGPEQNFSRPHTCVRQVPEVRTRQVPVVIPQTNPAGQIALPRMEMRTEQYTEMVPRPYNCTELVRSISAHFHVRVGVNAMTRPIREVYHRDLDVTDDETQLGLSGSDSDDHQPPGVDGAAVLEALQQRAAVAFVREILPRSDRLEVEFADCHDSRCENAMSLARTGTFDVAIATLTQVVDQNANPLDDAGRERFAAALFNRGVVRGYTGAFAEGIDDLTHAIALRPAEATWGNHLARLRGLQQEQASAAFRGETTTPGHDLPVQRRGHPVGHPPSHPHAEAH